MRIAFLILLLIHGFIHLLGFAKAFRLASFEQLTGRIGKVAGSAWLLSCFLFIGAGAGILLHDRSWWVTGGFAVILSQILIIISWRDARFGTILNFIIFVPVIIAGLGALPTSHLNEFRAAAGKRLIIPVPAKMVTETDLVRLPPQVQRYLRFVGAVGRPQIDNFHALFHGEFKPKINSRWIEFESRQYNFYDSAARFFFIESSLFGIPFDGLHIYDGGAATMRIKLAHLFQVADARGPMMNQGETVTLFNDMCLMAPSRLADAAIQWTMIDSSTVEAEFTNGGITIEARLSFDKSGALTDFISDDRFLSEDGTSYENYPWSTPVKEFKEFDGRKVASSAETIWHTQNGEYIYGKFELDTIEYNCVAVPAESH